MAAIPRQVAGVLGAVSIVAATGLLLLGTTASLPAQTLQTIRSDVRDPPPSPPAPQSSNSRSCGDSDDDSPLDELKGFAFLYFAELAGRAVLSPIWVPHYLLNDNYNFLDFHQFPYDDTANPPETFPFAIRFDADYVAAFDNLDRINGHVLISTASRIEIDARFQHLAEHLGDGTQDQLWTGDCNVTYRFAQNERMQFRAGLGINWMNDATETDVGFNFTYGADFFPARPWVFSAVLDAGTLGHAGLFRFRTTAGVIYRSVELYTGYEYTDIGAVHWNGLIGGVRLWF